MRGELTAKFLEFITEFAGDATDHLEGFLNAGFGASFRSMEYETRKARVARQAGEKRFDEKERLRRRYSHLLNTLKSDGLVTEKYNGDRKVLEITQEGRFKLRNLKYELKERLVVPVYALEDDNRVLIVSFDVPEKERRKRAWLRSVLKNMGLKMVQRSVWVGKGAVPKSFLDDLNRMRLTEFVEVFQVTKSGSLAHIF